LQYKLRVADCRQRTNLADTSKLYKHKYGTTDKLKSMDNSSFNIKLEYETVLQKSWNFLSYCSWDPNTNPL